VRDSPLTTHGNLQIQRLAQHLHACETVFTHVFASPLSRALQTAEAIHALQPASTALVTVPELREQDFGLYEGVPVGAYGRVAEDPRRMSVETADQMAVRARIFIADYLVPSLQGTGRAATVAVVSHGCLLRVLWREVLSHFKPNSVLCEQQMLFESQSIDYMRLGHWSNTGYLEVMFSQLDNTVPQGLRSLNSSKMDKKAPVSNVAPPSNDKVSDSSSLSSAPPVWTAKILTINAQGHCKTLKRTRGGIGSAEYDSRQVTLDKFFKRDLG
jgi:Histidine phosphatase superfamily (branch 1)